MQFELLGRLLTLKRGVIAALIIISSPALLAATTLAPVVLEVSTAERATLSITNQSDRSVPYQLSLLSWKQSNGKDEYSPTDDLLISPAAVTLAPGESREIRIGFRERPKRGNIEAAYRVLIEELPDRVTPSQKSGLVLIAVKHLVPLYVAPSDQKATPSVRWSAQRDNNMLRIRAENSGNRHLFIRDLAITPATQVSQSDSASHPRPTGRSVLLAKSYREWTLPISAQESTQNWTLLITDQFGQINRQNLSLQSR